MVDSIASTRTWYLLIRHCTRGKFGVVMKCTARFHGMSTNDCLEKVPEHIRSLLGVLLCFQQYHFGFTADIKSMYSQCRVLAVDQSSLKFLYIDQGDPHRPFVDMRMALQAYSITLLGVSPGSSCNVLLPTTILVHQHLVKCLFETCKLTTYRSHLKLLLTH